MKGYDEFVKLFGDISLLHLVELILAASFLIYIGKKTRDYLIKRHEAELKKEDALKEALEGVRKYPEYRKQSIQIQELLESEIQALREMQKESNERLTRMEEETRRRERNKLRDRLLQNYRHYANKEINPSQAWTKMEAEAFWALFRDYEEAGGNGYMHSVVQPAMELLTVSDVDYR